MIDFRDRRAAIPNSLVVLSLITLVCALLFHFFAPKPTTQGMANASRKLQRKAQLDTEIARQRLDQAKQVIDGNTWAEEEDEIVPQIVRRLNALAEKRKIRVVNVRPQRKGVALGIETLPFIVTLEGSFPNVVEWTRDVDATGSRLAVSLIQVTSSDAESDRVTATIGTVAYRRPKPGAKPTTGSSTVKGARRA